MSLARSSLLFTAGSLISRFSGLARDMIIAGVFGASATLDAFFVALRIPNLLRDMLAEGALGSSFTSIFTRIAAEDEGRARHFLLDVLVATSLLAVVVCGLGVLFAEPLVTVMTLMANKSSSGGQDLAVQAVSLTRILFPVLALSILSAIVCGTLHQMGSFFRAAVATIGLNAGYIIGALVLGDWLTSFDGPALRERFGDLRIVGLALGVMLGAAIELVIETSGIWRRYLRGAWHGWRPLRDPELVRVFTLMLPAAVAASAGQINVLVNTNFATSLDTGAVTWLNFSFRLLQLPVGLFGVAVGVVTLPSLSRAIAAAGRKVDAVVSSRLQEAVELVLWLLTPCLVMILMRNLPMVRLIYQAGAFSAADALATSQALFGYGLGLLAYGLIKVLTSFYYAVGATSYAMRISLVGIAINFFGNLFFVKVLGHVGLAVTASATLTCNAGLLLFGLHKRGVRPNWMSLKRSLLWLAVGGATSYTALVFTDGFWGDALESLPIKVAAGVTILADGALVVGIFLSTAAWRLGQSPRTLVNKIWQYRASKRSLGSGDDAKTSS